MKSLYSVLSAQKAQTIDAFSSIAGTTVSLLSSDQTKFPCDIYDITSRAILVLHDCINFEVFTEYCQTNNSGSRRYLTVPLWTVHTYEVSKLLNWVYAPDTSSELAILIDSITEDTSVSFDGEYIFAIGGEVLNADVTWPMLLSHFNAKASTPLWHARELNRFSRGTYKSIHRQALNLLSKEQVEIVNGYFPHLSEVDESMIAYTATPEKGEADIQTRIKPGRFLNKVLPGIDNELVKSFAAVFSSTDGIRLVAEKSPEAFSYAYTSLKNSGSCMDSRNSFSKCVVDGVKIHPSVAYYNPDNKLFAIYAVNSIGTVIARCIGNASEMRHTRIYFDKNVPNSENKMILLLKEAGWEHGEDCLHGVKISKLITDEGSIICPYIDPHNVGVYVYDDYLEVGGDVETNVDSSLLKYDEFVAFCDCCGSGIEWESDTFYTYEEETICSSCCTNRYTTAFDLHEMHYTFVSDNSPHLYTFSGMMKLPYGNKLYDGDKVVEVQACNELVHLDREFYDSNLVAYFADCYINTLGNGVLNEDMDRFGIFYNYEVEDICYVDSWIVLDGSLKRVWPGDDLDEYELDFSSAGDEYPMLKCYKTK